MNAHTPTPWEVDGYGITSKVFNICMLDTTAKDMDENQIGMGELSANAAFIVRAVNAHEELVKELKDAIIDLESIYEWAKQQEKAFVVSLGMRRRLSQMKQALAKAEGER